MCLQIFSSNRSQTIEDIFTCLKLTTETLKQGEIKFTPCSSVSVVTFEQVNAG